MALLVESGGGRQSQGGAAVTLQVLDNFDLGMNFAPGNNPGWTDGGFARYGGDVVTLTGLNAWASGSAGATPNRGYAVQRGQMWRRARNTVASAVPIDWYCGISIHPTVDIPPVNIPSPMSCYEVSGVMMLDALPAVAIDRDCGLVFIMSANTTFANTMRAGVAAGNDFAGFGIVFNGTNGELLWIVKKNGAGGGAPLTEQVSLGIYGANRPIPFRVRFQSARVGLEAKVEVFIDEVGPVISRNWGAGTVLPVAADATFQPVLGYFRAMMRAGQPSTANSALLFNNMALRAASNVAFFDSLL